MKRADLETHAWRKPGFFDTPLFPGFCAGWVSVTWGREPLAERLTRMLGATGGRADLIHWCFAELRRRQREERGRAAR